ncbi:hypothetical protein D3C85_894650 [compost metagenome]
MVLGVVVGVADAGVEQGELEKLADGQDGGGRLQEQAMDRSGVEGSLRGSVALVLERGGKAEGLGEVFLVHAIDHARGLDPVVALDEQARVVAELQHLRHDDGQTRETGEDGRRLFQGGVALVADPGGLEDVGGGRPCSRPGKGEGPVRQTRDGHLLLETGDGRRISHRVREGLTMGHPPYELGHGLKVERIIVR